MDSAVHPANMLDGPSVQNPESHSIIPIANVTSSPNTSTGLERHSIIQLSKEQIGQIRWSSMNGLARNDNGFGEFTDILFEIAVEYPIARITINRPHVLNAFRPRTLREIEKCLLYLRDDVNTRCIILTGQGSEAFCSGGDQTQRGHGGYVGHDGVPRLEVLDLQILMRRLPKPIIAAVAGYAVGGGHILHMVCDLTIASSNAKFGQSGPRVGSFDGGYGSSHMARIIGQKRARELWFLCRLYDAQTALQWGLVNAVVPPEDLMPEAIRWAVEISMKSPTAIACLKAALNADEDGQAGLSQLAGEATRLFYQSDEGKEGRNAFVEKRKPEFAKVAAKL